ncbi:MAG TPA: DUF302 domain-containing protein [Thiobacillaceae bacterium]|nr:DUF302 domain-containing protein [Thiobacillaceae bacterium]
MRVLLMIIAGLLALAARAEPVSVTKAVSLRQAVDDLTLAAANHDLVLVKVQPIDSALVKRGFEDPHVRILFVGSETAVRWAEAADPRLLNLLPLRLTLIEREGRVTVLSDDFEPWLGEFPTGEARLFLKAWQAELKATLEDFVGQ